MTDPIDTSTSSAVVVAATAKPTLNGNGRIVWPEAPSLTQNFSLPDNIIYYMAKNPSTPEEYLKLAMSCKYFFEMKPLLIAARTDGDAVCSSKNEKECDNKNHKCCAKIDAKLTSKIWLTHLYYFNNTPTSNTLLRQKIFKSQSAYLNCWFQRIEFENLKLVASSFQKFSFNCEIADKDGNTVKLEEILGSLPNVKEFHYTFDAPAATAISVKNVAQLGNLNSLRILSLSNIPQLGEVKDIEDFIMSHMNTKIWLHFGNCRPEYTSQLNALCDTLIKSEVCKCVIEYPGQDDKEFYVMRERYYK